MSYNVLKYVLFLICTFCYSFAVSSETYIDYDGLSKIELNMNKDDVVSVLGEPILVLADSEYDNTIYLFYNYHIKSFLSAEKNDSDIKTRAKNSERITLLKFTFFENTLVSWEEDNMALGMADKNLQKKSGIMNYALILINLVLLLVHLHPV